MGFKEFVKKVKESIKDYLPAEYQDATVDVRKLRKINKSYMGIALNGENRTSPVLNLDAYYQDYIHGSSFSDCMESMAAAFGMEHPTMDLRLLEDYNMAKKQLFIRVSGSADNKRFLQSVPHTIVEDMAITYHLLVDRDELGIASGTVTNKLLETYGVTMEELHKDAVENSEKLLPAKICGMNDMIKEQFASDMREEGMQEEEIDELLADFPQENAMNVVTNDLGVNGAAVIFYPNMMEELAERMEGNYFVLPSSVHETLILPDNGEFAAAYLKQMVTEINQTTVSPNDQLTDEVYHYDSVDKVFEKASSFEIRQREKAEEKGSVIEKLGTKKEAAKEMNSEHRVSARTAELVM